MITQRGQFRRLKRLTPDAAVVLLVEPDADDRDMYREFLDHRGFAPVAIANASSALALAPKADVIVTDTLLPGSMGGIALVARLRSDERTKQLPIIVLTECAWQTERERAFAGGCDVFLPKPCLPDLLVSEIRRVLALHRVPKPQPARVPHAPKHRL